MNYAAAAAMAAGGFKLWEGAIDLCNYLVQQHQLTPELLSNQQSTSSLQVSAYDVKRLESSWLSAASLAQLGGYAAAVLL